MLGEVLGRLRQHGGGGMVGRAVTPLFRQALAQSDCHSLLKFGIDCRLVLYTQRDLVQGRLCHLGFGQGVDIAGICNALHAGAYGLGGIFHCSQVHEGMLDTVGLQAGSSALHGVADIAHRSRANTQQQYTARLHACSLVKLQRFASGLRPVTVLAGTLHQC